MSIGTNIHPDTDQHDVIFENLGLVLRRSKDVPLSYKLDLYEDHDLPHPSNTLSAMRAGTKITHALFGDRTRSRRVRHLAADLARGGWPVATELAGAYGRELENLYGIEIRLDYFSAVEASTAIHPFLVPLPCTQITILVLSGSRVQTVSVALEALPNLITADITLEWNHFMNGLDEQAPDCPTMMTCLKTLSITVRERHYYPKCHFEVASWILASITTPSLSQFSLCIEGGLGNGSAALGLEAASNLAQFFARSDPVNLRRVDITGLFPAAGLSREYGSIFDFLPKHVKDLLQRGHREGRRQAIKLTFSWRHRR
ncbi:hypothetical protein V5O48_011885 [Marasmius crinis-equi]|uniref:Uncharacterized protein n=1 Tax=Marasmius crinis-equi TaxID=585013 RepID=A0ABR3F4D5_9AGAR